MNEIELKRQKMATWAKWSLGLLGAVVISPVIFLAVKGLVGLAIAGIVGLTIISFAPVLSMKFANWKIKGIKSEAATNPIETLQVQLIEKKEALLRFLNSINSFAAEVKGFEDKVEQFKREHPSEAAQFDEQLKAMIELLENRKLKYRRAREQVNFFEASIDRARAKWEMAQAAIRMNKLAGMQTGDEYEKIKVETAIDSVQTAMNTAFAELETALLSEEHPPMLPNQTTAPGVLIIEQPVREGVQR